MLEGGANDMPEVLQDDVLVEVYMCLCFKWLGSNAIYCIDPSPAIRHPSGYDLKSKNLHISTGVYALKFWSGTDFRADLDF